MPGVLISNATKQLTSVSTPMDDNDTGDGGDEDVDDNFCLLFGVHGGLH